MSRPADAGWIRVADKLFGGVLWLYPKQLRADHGDEMRQAFRDRCREVVRGERSAFRVFALELLPDTLRSAGQEQWSASFDQMRPRQMLALGLLCCAATGLLFQERLSRATLDLAFQAKYALRNYQDAREALAKENQVRRLADSLSASGNVESKALAAYLYRFLYTSREQMYQYPVDRGGSPFAGKLAADGDRANAAAVAVLAARPDIYPLLVAVQACEPELGCNRESAIRRLTQRDPDNGYGWSLAFESAAQKVDRPAMREALARMAGSSHFENYKARIRRDLFESARKLAPADEDFRAVIESEARMAAYLASDDYRYSVRRNCSPRSSGAAAYDSRWIEVAPEIKSDCSRVARLLSQSSDIGFAHWAWRQLYLQAPDAASRAAAFDKLRNAKWLWLQAQGPGSTRLVDGSWGRKWDSSDWNRWYAAWAPGDGEIPAMKRWLAAQGQPVEAPADFAIPPP